MQVSVYITFFDIFLLFFMIKICVFIIFVYFFDEVSNYRNRTLTRLKMELVIRNCQCDKWPKLYDKWPFVTCTLLLTHSNIPKIYQLTRWRYTFIFESLASKNKAKFIFRLTMNFRDFLFLNHSFKGHACSLMIVRYCFLFICLGNTQNPSERMMKMWCNNKKNNGISWQNSMLHFPLTR